MIYTKEELMLLQGMEGKTLSQVFYHLWVNNADAADPMHFIDFIELRFNDKTNVVLHRPDGEERIQPLKSIDVKKLNNEVLLTFEGKIKYVSKDMSGTLLWQGLIGSAITAVLLDEDGPGIYTTEALVLEAGETKVLINLSMREGLEAGPFGIVDEEEAG